MISQAKRKQVFSMYNGRCAYCGFIMDGGILGDSTESLSEFVEKLLHNEQSTQDNNDPFLATVDHIKPQVNGGKDDISNLLPACKECNHIKDHMNLEMFRTVLKTGKIPGNHSSKRKKELEHLINTRYKALLGQYKGVKPYDWKGTFFYEKDEEEQDLLIDVIDKIKEHIVPGRKNIRIVTKGDIMGIKATISKGEAKKIYERDGWRCSYCGCTLIGGDNKYGHDCASPSMIDNSLGYDYDNTVASCNQCKVVKRRLDLEEFRSAMFMYGLEEESIKTKLAKHGDEPDCTRQAQQTRQNRYEDLFKFGKKFYFEHTALSRKKVENVWDQKPVHNKEGQEKYITSKQVSGSAFRKKKTEKPELLSELYEEPVLEEPVLEKPEGNISANPASASMDADDTITKLMTFITEYKELKAERTALTERLQEIDAKLEKYKEVIQTFQKAVTE